MNSDCLNEIGETLNHELVFGLAYFKERIARMAERRTTTGLPGRPRIEGEAGVRDAFCFRVGVLGENVL